MFSNPTNNCNKPKGVQKKYIDGGSKYSSAVETAVLSSLLEVIKFENEETSQEKLLEESPKARPQGLIPASQLREMLSGAMDELISSKRKLCSKTHVENATTIDHFCDRGAYTGELSQGEPHGQGIMIYEDNRSYDGGWDHGRYDGKATTTYASGDSYTGEYKSDFRHGKGKYTWQDRREYNGEFHDDERQGRGVYSWPDGSCYTGSFMSGNMHGSGLFLYKCGSKYRGAFRRGQYHGYGQLTSSSSGSCYEGNFRLGKKQGPGKETNPDGSIRHDGVWYQDLPIGEEQNN